MKKTNNKKTTRKIVLLEVMALLLGFQLGLAVYIMSNFLKERSGTENVGVFYFIAYIAALFVLVNMHYLVKKHGKSKVFMIFVLMKASALFGIGLFAHSQIAVIFAVISLMSGVMMWAGLDLLLENFTRDSVAGKVRGTHLTVLNFGVLVAPFLAAEIVETSGFRPVFFLGSSMTLAALFLTVRYFPKINHNVKKALDTKKVIGKMMRRKNILRIYIIAILLAMFYAVINIYTPIYLLDIGMHWSQIGLIFTVMLIPFVVVQFPLGITADKKTGEKEWLVLGLILLVLATALLSFVTSTSVVLWMVLLFGTRTGAAIIEVMRDSYFYKQVGARDVDLIDFFRTAKCVAFIVGTALFSLLLFFIPLKMVFLTLALIMLTGLIPLWKLRDTK